jgi:hypothetical protein
MRQKDAFYLMRIVRSSAFRVLDLLDCPFFPAFGVFDQLVKRRFFPFHPVAFIHIQLEGPRSPGL